MPDSKPVMVLTMTVFGAYAFCMPAATTQTCYDAYPLS